MATDTATAAESDWLLLIGRVGCVICRRFTQTGLPVERHHVAPGSSERFHHAAVPLCGTPIHGGHHRQPGIGLHGMGTEAFCRLYRVPWLTEEGLLVWTIQDVNEYLRQALRMRGLNFGRLL